MARRLILALAVGLVAVAPVMAGTHATAGTPATAPRRAAALRPITIGMGYIPNVQFAPYYVAAARGYYRQAGLDVTFSYALSYNLLQLVGAGKVDVANADGTDTLQAVAHGVPLVYVMGEYQRFPVAIFALASKHIRKVADLRGKTIGIPGPYGANYVGLLAALRAAGLGPKDVSIKSIGYTQVESVAAGKVDAAVGYSVNEPVILARRGYAVSVIQISDVANLVAPGLVVGKGLLARDPTLVRDFVRATLHGLADTIADPRAAFAISRTEHGLTTLSGRDADDAYAVLLHAVAFWHGPLTRAHGLGYSDPAQWTYSARILHAIGQLPALPGVDSVYTNRLITGSARL